MFGYSRLTWTWAVAAEVFALNNFLLSLLLAIAVYFRISSAEEKPKVSYEYSFSVIIDSLIPAIGNKDYFILIHTLVES